MTQSLSSAVRRSNRTMRLYKLPCTTKTVTQYALLRFCAPKVATNNRKRSRTHPNVRGKPPTGRESPTANMSFCRLSVCRQNDERRRFRRSDLCRPKSAKTAAALRRPSLLLSGRAFAFFWGVPKEGRLPEGRQTKYSKPPNETFKSPNKTPTNHPPHSTVKPLKNMMPAPAAFLTFFSVKALKTLAFAFCVLIKFHVFVEYVAISLDCFFVNITVLRQN